MKPGNIMKFTNTAKTVKRKWFFENEAAHIFDNPKRVNAVGETPRQQWAKIKDSSDLEFIESVIGEHACKSPCVVCFKLHRSLVMIGTTISSIKMCPGCIGRIHEFSEGSTVAREYYGAMRS